MNIKKKFYVKILNLIFHSILISKKINYKKFYDILNLLIIQNSFYLDLRGNEIDINFLDNLKTFLLRNLNLKKLELNFSQLNLDNNSIYKIINILKYLKKIEIILIDIRIFQCNRYSNEFVYPIVNLMPNLKKINLYLPLKYGEINKKKLKNKFKDRKIENLIIKLI